MKIRAGLISGKKTETKSTDKFILVVEFLLGTEKYAIDSSFVKEVLHFRNLTLIPGTPNFVVGLMNIRGRIVSVINLLSLLKPKEMAGVSVQNKVLVMEHNHMEFGIITDEILGTTQLDISSFRSTHANIRKSAFDFIQGISSDGIILLNAIAILSDDKIIINQK